MANELSPALQAFLPRFIQIESGGNPNAQTGSYSGLLQMGPDEIAKYGGNGLEQGVQLLADRAAQLGKVLGREPTPTELYLAHQQGLGGAQAHLSNPDTPAWQNMASTAEGRQKGDAWAKRAIWGNVPDDIKAQFPDGVDSLTSRQFVDLWRSKVERSPAFNSPPQQGASLPAFSWSPGSQSGALPKPQEVANNAPAPISGPQIPQPTPQPAPSFAGAVAPQQQQAAPAQFTPPPLNAPPPIQEVMRQFNLARAFQKIPTPANFRGFSYS